MTRFYSAEVPAWLVDDDPECEVTIHFEYRPPYPSGPDDPGAAAEYYISDPKNLTPQQEDRIVDWLNDYWSEED
jgi:hypothetical protein